MPNKFRSGVQNLLGRVGQAQQDPNFQLGLGLLAGGAPRANQGGIGQNLGTAMQFAGQQQQQQQQNNLLRQRSAALQQAQEQEERTQGLLGRLPGLLQDSGVPEAQANLLGQLAHANPASIPSIVQSLVPDASTETSDLRNARALADETIPQGIRDELRTLVTPGNENLNVPISIAGLNGLVDADGNHPPPGTTFAEAATLGFKTQNAAEIVRATAGRSAEGLLGQMEEMAFGEGGVFIGSEPGLANRALETAQTGLDLLTQENPNVSRYQDFGRASVAPFIKYLGEVGALAEGDVDRALGLLPRLFPFKDTEVVARGKLASLKAILGVEPEDGIPIDDRLQEFNGLPDAQKGRIRQLTDQFMETAVPAVQGAVDKAGSVFSDTIAPTARDAANQAQQFGANALSSGRDALGNAQQSGQNALSAGREQLGNISSQVTGQAERLRTLGTVFGDQAMTTAGNAADSANSAIASSFNRAADVARLTKEQFNTFFQGKSEEEIDAFLVTLPPEVRSALEKRADEISL